jgi:hypothetical protein
MSSRYIRRSRFRGRKGIPALIQIEAIKEAFPEAKTKMIKWGHYEVIVSLNPKNFSRTYDVKIVITEFGAQVYVVNEVLEIAKSRKKLPHVYSHENQQLCLFSVSQKEWNSKQLIIKTLIPWASEWLFYYEIWLINGDWLGGGHDEYASDNKVQNKII